MRLLFLTGSRGEWGYIRPVIQEAQRRGHKCDVVVTNMHLSEEHGSTWKELDCGELHLMPMESHDDNASHGYALGGFLAHFAPYLCKLKPDWLVLAGDRGEQLMGAIAGAYSYIPTAHIQAGEVSGNIDNAARMAMAKLCHLHLSATEMCVDRLIAMGEEQWRCRHTGAPQLDEMYPIPVNRPRGWDDFYLVVMHPTTDETAKASQQVAALRQAVLSLDAPAVWIGPNNDPGWRDILKDIPGGVVSNMPRKEYLLRLRWCKCLIGNSSSGLLEAPSYGTPAVNIGRRQHGRERAESVFDCGWFPSEIVTAVREAMAWKVTSRVIQNPYGDGKSAVKVVTALEKYTGHDGLTTKEQAY